MAEEWRAVLSDLELWSSEPEWNTEADGRPEIDSQIKGMNPQIKRLIAAIRKEEPKWSVGSHRTSAAVSREVYMLCKFSDGAGIWPTGLLDALRLVLNVPATATMTVDGNHADTQTPQMRAVAEYWRKNPSAKNSEVGRNVLNSKGKPLDATGVRNLLDPRRHPGFAEYVDELKAAAKKRTARSGASALRTTKSKRMIAV